jgi:acetoin utilization protein AcuB
MILEKIMSKRVVTVGLDDSLRVIKEIFDEGKIHHLLVEEQNQLYGVISELVLWRAISPNLGSSFESVRDTATLNKRAHHIMTRKPITLPGEADIFEAISIFNRHRISCIPIVTSEQHIVGIITWRDIFLLLEVDSDALCRASD